MFFLSYRLARRVFHDEIVARLTVMLLTLYPNQIAYTGVLFADTFATFLLLLAIDVFVTRPTPWRALAAALLFGYGALVKAQFLLLPGILLGLYGWRCWHRLDETLRIALLAAIFAIGVGAVVAPVTMRNYLAFDRFVLISTNGGLTFLNGNNPEARGGDTQKNSLVADVNFSFADEVAAEKRAYTIAMNWIRNNPGRFLMLAPLKVWHLWVPDGDGEWWFQAGYAGYENHVLAFRALRIINQIYYLALLVGATVAVALLATRGFEPAPWVLLGVLFVVYLTLISIAFSGQSRYHIPAMPLLMAYDGWLLSQWLRSRHLQAIDARNPMGEAGATDREHAAVSAADIFGRGSDVQ